MSAAATNQQPNQGAASQAERHAAAVCYALDGDLRFISHHDEIRMLVRALTRARWPLAYSQGFNPKPRVVIPLPRSVGLASECVRATVQLKAPADATMLFDSLANALPTECRLVSVTPLDPGVKPHPLGIHYEIKLDQADAEKAAARIPALLKADSIEVRRDYGPDRPSRAVDIRPSIESVTLDGSVLRVSLLCSDGGAARPGEVLRALDLPADEYNHLARRVKVDWDIEFAEAEIPPANDERKQIGQGRDRRVD